MQKLDEAVVEEVNKLQAFQKQMFGLEPQIDTRVRDLQGASLPYLKGIQEALLNKQKTRTLSSRDQLTLKAVQQIISSRSKSLKKDLEAPKTKLGTLQEQTKLDSASERPQQQQKFTPEQVEQRVIELAPKSPAYIEGLRETLLARQKTGQLSLDDQLTLIALQRFETGGNVN